MHICNSNISLIQNVNIMTQKEEILAYFAEDRSFLSGVRLFSKYGRNHAFAQLMNRKGESPENLAKIHFQLWKLTGLPEAKMNETLRVPTMPTDPAEQVKLIPEEVVKTIKLREVFPFLATKDCPRELKILVNDMLTTYETYKKAHQALMNADVEEEIAKLSEEVVENYLENRQIWDELQHYKEKGEVLGQHPIFSEMVRQDELAAKGTGELIKLEKSLENNINRTKAQLAKEDKPHLNQERTERLEAMQKDRVIVRRLLNLS
jgi:hypothetical protein